MSKEKKKKKKLKVGLFAGSFNPFHIGHEDILDKALLLFDKVIIAQGLNPLKELPQPILMQQYSNVEVITYDILLIDLIDKIKPTALIRGLRDPNDFLSEQKFQYMLEDYQLDIPIVYLISDRQYVHVSSTMFRALQESEKKAKG